MSRPSFSGTSSPPTRKSLLARLKNWQDAESWQEFSDTYTRLIRNASRCAGLTPEEAQEVVQETLLTVAKKIAGFDYDPEKGSFKSWLMVITRRRIIDQQRKRNSAGPGRGFSQAPPGAGADGCVDPAEASFEARWNQEWERAILALAQQRVQRRVSPRQFQLFDLYVMQGLPVDEVKRRLRASAAQVYMAKYRVGRLLKLEIRRLQRANW
jgi:RNA polymerase sigma factor (sigma-70 family)